MSVACWRAFQDTLMLGIGCVSLAAYILVLIVLIKYSKSTFKRPFFKLCITLGVVEVIGLLESVIDPAIVLYMAENKDAYMFHRIWGSFNRMPWYAVLFHQLYIALERVTSLLYPKVHEKMWTKQGMICHYLMIIILTLATNICICTKTCEYILYEDGTTNFYNMSNPGAVLHNKIVDMGVQPCVIVIIIVLYLIVGIKIMKLRNQIRQNTGQAKNDNTTRKRRMEIMLVLQGFLISTPQAVTAIVYHIMIYIPLSDAVSLILNFVCMLFLKFVFATSPYLYLGLNTDVRVKVATLLIGENGLVESKTVGPVSAAPTGFARSIRHAPPTVD